MIRNGSAIAVCAAACLATAPIRAQSTPLFSGELVRLRSAPSAVALADFDGDGRPDVLTASPYSGIDVLMGNGAGRLERGHHISLDGMPVAVVTGDWNGDGRIDAAVTLYTADRVVWLLNLPGVGLSLAGSADVGKNPVAIACADFDLDGDIDLAIADQGSGEISLLRGDGAGGFAAGASLQMGGVPNGLAIGDWDHDGLADLAAADKNASRVVIWFQALTGGFEPPAIVHVAGGSVIIASGDWNGDGVDDLAAAGSLLGVLIADGNGGFLPERDFESGPDPHPRCMVSGDIDRDGALDIAIGNFVYGSNITVQYGDGSGTFVGPTTIHGVFDPYGAALADLDCDGWLDLVVADNLCGVVILLGDQAGRFLAGEPSPSGIGGAALALGDLDGDGLTDIVVAGSSGETDSGVSILRGDAGGGQYLAGQLDLFGIRDLEIADSDLDGIPDLMAIDGQTAFVLRGLGETRFERPRAQRVGLDPRGMEVGDWNGDHVPDVVVFNAGSNDLTLLIGNGDGALQVSDQPSAGVHPDSLAAGDLDGDGNIDFAVVDHLSPDVLLLFGDGRGGIARRGSLHFADWAVSVAAGDFDADGVSELVVASVADTAPLNLPAQIHLLASDAHGVFVEHARLAAPFVVRMSVARDLDGDRRPDLTFMFGGFGVGTGVCLGESGLGLGAPSFFAVGAGMLDHALGDLDGDGHPDWAIAVYDQPVRILRNLCPTPHGAH